MKWINTNDELPEKGISVLGCDICNDGEGEYPYYYITHLYRRSSTKRKENWWHQYHEKKEDDVRPHYWCYFPEPPYKLEK